MRGQLVAAMIYDRAKIRWHYLRTGFFIDFISAVPWDVIISQLITGSTSMFQVVRSLNATCLTCDLLRHIVLVLLSLRSGTSGGPPYRCESCGL